MRKCHKAALYRLVSRGRHIWLQKDSMNGRQRGKGALSSYFLVLLNRISPDVHFGPVLSKNDQKVPDVATV